MTTPISKSKISVIICALNEADSIPSVLVSIPCWVDEVILVDGHSKDATVEVAKKIRPDIVALVQPNRGKGDAIKCGLRHARGEIVVTLDADGSTDPAEMHKFINALESGYDFAKGTRLANGRPAGMPFTRFLGNLVLATASSILVRKKYTDVCSGYNAFWKKSLPVAALDSDGFEMEQEINVKVAKFGLRIIEIPHSHLVRTTGASKVNDVKQGLKDLFVVAFDGLRPFEVFESELYQDQFESET